MLSLIWGFRYFWKRGNTRKRVCWNRGLKHLFTLCIGGFQEIPCKVFLLFYCFLVIKTILKALFSSISWLTNSSDLPTCGLNLRKRRTLRLFSMWTTPPPPPLLRFSLWFPYPLFSSAFHLVVAKILQTRTKFTQKLTPGFKNHMRNLDNFRQAVKNPKSWNSRHEFWPKNRFLQLIIADNLSNITFNYLYENSANSLCHFWNYKSFFTTKLLRIFLAQALHTFNKSSP